MHIRFTYLVGLLAISILPAVALAQNDALTTQAQPPVTAASADAAAPAVSVSAPPVVTYEKGQLTVVGNNAMLSDILRMIQDKTGTTIESAAGMSAEPILEQIGPADPAAVIASLLNGTSLNYVLVGSSDGSGLAKVILSIRPAHVEVQTAEAQVGRHHHRGSAEGADPQQTDPLAMNLTPMSNMPDTAAHRRHHHGGTDPQSNSSDPSQSNNTNVANNGFGQPIDPNAMVGIDGANSVGSSPGQPILPSDAPANIMKAIQHGSGAGGTPVAHNSGFGPTPTGLGGSMPAPVSGGSVTLPNGGTIMGPAVQLPNGAMFFPGGVSINLHR